MIHYFPLLDAIQQKTEVGLPNKSHVAHHVSYMFNCRYGRWKFEWNSTLPSCFRNESWTGWTIIQSSLHKYQRRAKVVTYGTRIMMLGAGSNCWRRIHCRKFPVVPREGHMRNWYVMFSIETRFRKTINICMKTELLVSILNITCQFPRWPSRDTTGEDGVVA